MYRYSVPTSIIFGPGQAQELSTHLSAVTSAQKWLVVTDPGVLNAGILDPILNNMHQSGLETQVFSEVAQNPRETDCLVGADVFREVGAEAVLGIGGGSAMDTAKAIALLAVSGGYPQDYAENRRDYTAPAPIVCVPTTAGTGSEVTRSAVITESSTHRKLTLKHAELRPKLAVLDPLLTLSVPKSVTAATGIDALVHAIEGYTCTVTSPISQAFGARAMRTIIGALARATENGRDVTARTAMLEGSLLAGLCFGSADVAAVHCLAEGLGSVYDTPHGVANAIFLPEVLSFNAEHNLPLHAEIARHMTFASDQDTDADAVAKMIDGITALTKRIGIPTLQELGCVKEEDFDRIVQLAVENGSTPSNVRPIYATDYRRILETVFDAMALN